MLSNLLVVNPTIHQVNTVQVDPSQPVVRQAILVIPLHGANAHPQMIRNLTLRQVLGARRRRLRKLNHIAHYSSPPAHTEGRSSRATTREVGMLIPLSSTVTDSTSHASVGASTAPLHFTCTK